MAALTVGLGRLGLPERGNWRPIATYISSKPCRQILNRSSMQLALEPASLSTAVSYPREGYSRPIPLFAIVLVALAVHGPLLLMQLPAGSFDTNFHIFFASHYAHHWFDPWNEKWFAGFSQTTYPPLTHQWIALLSNVAGLIMGYMLVQLAAIILLVIGMYRYTMIWGSERAASLAAIGSIFLGSLAMLVYQSGQLP